MSLSRFGSQERRKYQLWMPTLALFGLISTTAFGAVLDFRMPLTNIVGILASNSVGLAVFDPAQGRTIETNISYMGAEGLTVADGIAVWSGPSRPFFGYSLYTYDPSKTNWTGFSTTNFNIETPYVMPLIEKGVVLWTTYKGQTSYVYSAVYDRALSTWRSLRTEAPGALETLEVDAGNILWTTDRYIGYLIFVPGIAGAFGGRSSWGGGFLYYNAGGVISWVTPGATLHSATVVTFDAIRRQWKSDIRSASQSISRLESADGVVAWREGTRIHFQIYDPLYGRWMYTNGVITGSPIFSISNATVHCQADSAYSHGYNPALGVWQPNMNTKPEAIFTASSTNGNPPMNVAFIDMSIAAANTSWNFDDGSPGSSERTPIHRYVGFAEHRPSLRVTSASGESSTTNLLIRVDASGPVGTLWVNGGSTWTSNPQVNLHLVATDNSGVVASNRFSNDNTNWTAWAAYSTNRAWMLTGGFEPKTVYVQVADRMSNVTTLSRGILYDGSAPPMVRFVSTNVSESLTRIDVVVSLSETSRWPVIVNCLSTNGTATGGVDFSARVSEVRINPGSDYSTFRVPIGGDNLVEGNETVVLDFVSVINAIAGPPAVLTILDDDQPPFFSDPQVISGSVFRIAIETAIGRRIVVQSSETLTNWVPVATLTNLTGFVDFTVPYSNMPPSRFYRAYLVP